MASAEASLEPACKSQALADSDAVVQAVAVEGRAVRRTGGCVMANNERLQHRSKLTRRKLTTRTGQAVGGEAHAEERCAR